MPFGYSDYLRKNNYKELTIDEHVRQLEYFFMFIDDLYKRQKELSEILPSDIKKYLAYKKSQDLKTTTINKIISILRNFFDYAWTINAVAVDPAQKIRYENLTVSDQERKPYEEYLKILDSILSADIPIKRKVIYILAVNGLRPDEFQVTYDQIITEKSKVRIYISKPEHERIIIINGKSAEVIKIYINTQISDNTFLLNSKTRDGKEKPIERMTISLNLKKISEFVQWEETITTNLIRHAYAVYLLETETYESAAETLGIDKLSLMKLVSTK
ncbi:tyrosine-type recombinase/integrase [Alkalicoccus daliensis]|uniref:Site-specific recombinase XerD n=1 Tax=Alkalicoccus daliensis TaxID=745820 RepID=A0A1H0AH78_9BACI|nr:site-specific integrase [Alkalicoccus daliensis]SDN32785.1 Site-specific recombinase XerD [Alkalicoccus daliensis]